MPKPSSRRGAAASALLLLGGCADPRVPPPQPGWDMTVLRAAHAVDWHFVEVRMEGGTARERAEAELSPEAFPKADLPPGLSRDGMLRLTALYLELRDAVVIRVGRDATVASLLEICAEGDGVAHYGGPLHPDCLWFEVESAVRRANILSPLEKPRIELETGRAVLRAMEARGAEILPDPAERATALRLVRENADEIERMVAGMLAGAAEETLWPPPAPPPSAPRRAAGG